jgi:hypothetical protein
MRVKLSIAIINIKTIEIQWSLRVQGFSWCFLECLGYWWNSLGFLVIWESVGAEYQSWQQQIRTTALFRDERQSPFVHAKKR